MVKMALGRLGNSFHLSLPRPLFRALVLDASGLIIGDRPSILTCVYDRSKTNQLVHRVFQR